MNYVTARISRRVEEIRYRAYVTDAAQIAGSNTARFAGGSEMRVRFAELVYDFHPDTRTAEEVTEHIRARLSALGGD